MFTLFDGFRGQESADPVILRPQTGLSFPAHFLPKPPAVTEAVLAFSMLRSNPDNGLATDRLSRHLALIFPGLSVLDSIELKAKHRRGVI